MTLATCRRRLRAVVLSDEPRYEVAVAERDQLASDLALALAVVEAAQDPTVVGEDHRPRGVPAGRAGAACSECGRRWPCPSAVLGDALDAFEKAP